MTFFLYGMFAAIVAIGAAALADNGPLMAFALLAFLLCLTALIFRPSQANRHASRDLSVYGQHRVGYDETKDRIA